VSFSSGLVWIKFNPNKTESVLFTRKHNVDYHNVYFGNPDNIMTDVEMHCHLGLDFQNNCKWKNHITTIYEKAHMLVQDQINNLEYVHL
jgi:hypothetical protein